MKTYIIRRSILYIAITLPVYSCGHAGSPDIDYDTQLYLPVTELSFSADESYLNIEIISSGNISWIITDLPEWLSASPISSSVSENVRITAFANYGLERSAFFYVRSTSEAYPLLWKVSVTQRQAEINTVSSH